LARIVVTKRFSSELASLEPTVREAVADYVEWLAVAPRDRGYRLRGRLAGIWSAYAPGNHRVLFTLEGSDDERLVLRSLLHRPRGYPRGL
jgi:mRNA-degrading endonuclease RelE of RelBE toxin-antitoxin system